MFNGASETAYISPELKLGTVEPIWEAKIERPKVTKETTPVKTKRNEKTRETRKNIAVAKRKLKALRKRSAERKQASSQPQESETDRAEYMGSNYLNLDPEKDRRAYRRQYNEKHDPKIPLEDRRERVRNLIDEQYPKMHPMAKSELMRFPETVHLEGVPFVGVKTVKHRIEYSGPIYFQKQYKTPQVLEGEVLKEIDKLLEEDLIEGSDSGFSNAYLPVVKIDEKTKKRAVRLTLDMRRLNLGVIPDKLPIGDVQDILNRLHGCKYLSVIDASKGYLQIDLDEDSKKYTAFRHKNNAYQYKRMCFGLSGAPATWCRLVQTALSGIEGVYAYMDDLLLHSTTLDEHKKLIDQVLHRLSYHGIEISLKKCQWVQEKVEYLGFSVTSRGLTTQRKLLDPMIATPLPKTLKEARSLISTFSFYRRFIRGFSDIAHPLIQLTKGYPVGKGEHIPIETTPECKEALEKLKGKLKESVVLKYPDFSKKFIVNTDASLRGIGGALSQLDKDGHPRPLGFVSRSLTPTEARYPVVELEALALVYALKQFRPIILGYETELVTDHRPLVYLFRHVDPNSRLYRYQLAIQEFNIVGIEYITGQSNIVSDYLSRWSFQPDDDLAPAIACSLHSPLASTPPALFDYEKGQEVEIAEGNMLAFTSNTRNTQGFLQDGAIPDQEVILKQMYEGRKAVTQDIPVATKDTASSLGQVSYQRRNGMQYALCFTDVLETPEQASEKQKLLRSIRENEALKQEGFKFQLRNDKGPIRDYYFMLCLEKLAGECQQRKVRKLQIVWPKAQEESAKRVRHISSILRHCAYELSQQDIKCEVLQQPEIEVTDRDFIISALTVREAKAETEVKMKQHLAKFQKYQEEDPSFKAIIQSLKTGKPQEEHCLREGLLYRVETSASRGEVRRLCVPTRLRQDIMKEYHERDHHPGVAKTYYNCRSQCHWDNMRKDIKEHVIKCTICAQAKHSNNKRVLEGHLVIPPDAGHTYAIDIVGSLPKAGQYRKILVIVCTFSRFTAAAPLSAGSAVEVINALEKIFPLMGYPAQIVSDNAGNFTSDYFLDYLKGKGIEHQLTTPYTPTGNALAERSIRACYQC